jgi:hypothetical protein
MYTGYGFIALVERTVTLNADADVRLSFSLPTGLLMRLFCFDSELTEVGQGFPLDTKVLA